MGGFFYANSTLPPALVAFAKLFDAVAVICHSTSCDGQLVAWPSDMRVVVIDSAVITRRHRLKGVEKHGLLNTIAHGDALLTLAMRFTALRHALVLEADYRWVQEARNADEVSSLSSLASFVYTSRWQLLRLGCELAGSSQNRSLIACATWSMRPLAESSRNLLPSCPDVPIGDSHGVPPKKEDRLEVARTFAVESSQCPVRRVQCTCTSEDRPCSKPMLACAIRVLRSAAPARSTA